MPNVKVHHWVTEALPNLAPNLANCARGGVAQDQQEHGHEDAVASDDPHSPSPALCPQSHPEELHGTLAPALNRCKVHRTLFGNANDGGMLHLGTRLRLGIDIDAVFTFEEQPMGGGSVLNLRFLFEECLFPPSVFVALAGASRVQMRQVRVTGEKPNGIGPARCHSAATVPHLVDEVEAEAIGHVQEVRQQVNARKMLGNLHKADVLI
mmetsp:Transcript_6277/g.17097  ORF Transcript_6277/g.17097 Transcript_6277/m.17097 type:complete len:209 (+) Transcript_6277:994-1620(+)